jgi:hypothetical protein
MSEAISAYGAAHLAHVEKHFKEMRALADIFIGKEKSALTP